MSSSLLSCQTRTRSYLYRVARVVGLVELVLLCLPLSSRVAAAAVDVSSAASFKSGDGMVCERDRV